MANLVTDNSNGTFKTAPCKRVSITAPFDFFVTTRHPGTDGGTLEQGAYNGAFTFSETNRHLAPAVAPSKKMPITAPLFF